MRNFIATIAARWHWDFIRGVRFVAHTSLRARGVYVFVCRVEGVRNFVATIASNRWCPRLKLVCRIKLVLFQGVDRMLAGCWRHRTARGQGRGCCAELYFLLLWLRSGVVAQLIGVGVVGGSWACVC